MKIYTKTGDQGQSSLLGGQRVDKAHPLLQAYGTLDELNAVLGCALTFDLPDDLTAWLTRIQGELFEAGADLACPLDAKTQVKRLTPSHVQRLEADIDQMETELPPLTQFILPGGVMAAAQLHLARTVCRRAERHLVLAMADQEANPIALAYVNRLSDWLFTLARLTNHRANTQEQPWMAPS